MSSGIGEIQDLVSRALGLEFSLTPLTVKCTYAVFRGRSAAGESVFVKLAPKSEWERTAAVLRDVGDCRFFAKLLVSDPIEYHGLVVMISEWRDSKIVFPEDMASGEIDSFVAGCREFSDCLQRAKDYARIAESPLAPERLYGTVKGYVERHPLAGRLLADLMAIPESERTYAGHELKVVHGDFHAKNLGYVDGRFACVFDFDKLTQGLACGDLVNALGERYSLMGMSASCRRRLADASREIFAKCRWPKDELRIAANVLRLTFAARRIEKHPDSAWVALDVLRRDRRIRAILEAIG